MKFQRHNPTSTIATCRRALELGALVKSDHDQHWRFRGRLFHCGPVNRLIVLGEAIRHGGFVVRVKPHAD